MGGVTDTETVWLSRKASPKLRRWVELLSRSYSAGSYSEYSSVMVIPEGLS